MGKMRKCLLRIILVLTTLFVLFTGWLLSTESGLLLLQTGVNRFSDGLVHAGDVEGRVLGAWTIKDFSLRLPAIKISVSKLYCSWHPARLFRGEINISSLLAENVDINIADGKQKQSGENSSILANAFLPFGLVVKKLKVENLRVFDDADDGMTTIDLLTLGLETDGQLFEVHDFLLRGPEYTLTLHGTVDAGRNWQCDLLGNWNFAGFGFYKMDGTFSVAGPLEKVRVQLGIKTPADIRIAAEIENLLETPEWSLKLEGHNVDLSTLIESCPKIDLVSITADLTGNTHGYRGGVTAKGAYDVFDDLELTSTLSADWWGIDFSSLRIDRGKSSINAVNGTISWKDIFSWKGHFFARHLDPSLLFGFLPADVTTDFVSNGDVLENGVAATFKIVNLETVVHQYMLLATGNIFLTEAGVSTDGLILRNNEQEGFIRLNKGNFSWLQGLSWTGDVSLVNFDPSWLIPEFPGSINGNFSGEGHLGSSGVKGFLTIADLSGNLRGNELSGGGDITFIHGGLQTSGLVIKSGQSELILSGEAGNEVALNLDFHSPDLGQIIPGSGGAVNVEGSVTGNRLQSQIDVRLDGKELFYKDNSISFLQAKLHSEPMKNYKFAGSISGNDMRFSGIALDKGRIDATGTLAEHNIDIEGTVNSVGSFGVKAKGGYSEQWQGEISDLFVKSRKYGSFKQLNGAVALSAGMNNITIGNTCMSDGEGKVCFSGDIDLGLENKWSVESSAHSLSLSLSNRFTSISVPVVGQFDAHVFAEGDNSHIETAELELNIPQAKLRLDGFAEDVQTVRFGTLALKMNLADGLLKANFFTEINTSSSLRFNVDIDGVGDFHTPFENLPVKGRLDISDFDLSFLAAYTHYTAVPTGRVDSHFSLSGTVGKPRIGGEAHLVKGSVSLPFQGVTLKDITLSLTAEGKEAKVRCKAISGKGQLVAKGIVRYEDDGIQGDMQIEGNQFQLVDLPEYRIQISPDVHFVFSKEKGVLDGIIKIPYGLIRPEKLTDAVNASDDVVIVTDGGAIEEAAWPFYGTINVKLGDDVRIDGYGLTGKLEGAIKVKKTPETFLTGMGELTLEDGTFSLYGRSLAIKRGRVLFTGGPIDNPGLDVRAQKEVRGGAAKGEGYTVGVDISGLIHNLDVRLFSDPPMDDSEILSYMAIGSSAPGSGNEGEGLLKSAAKSIGLQGSSLIIDGVGDMLKLDDMHLEGSRDKGNISFVVGKRVTDDLYIGYDINMFTQLGEFRVRYDLTRGFFVETRSSTESTGADLLYTFEK